VCGLEFPDLEATLWQPYRDRGVEVIGINPLSSGDDSALIQDFIDQTGVTFPIGFDVEGTYDAFRVGDCLSPFPLDVIIAPDGTVAYLSCEYDGDAMRAVIDGLLGP
jgi:peroxiredoxin